MTGTLRLAYDICKTSTKAVVFVAVAVLKHSAEHLISEINSVTHQGFVFLTWITYCLTGGKSFKTFGMLGIF